MAPRKRKGTKKPKRRSKPRKKKGAGRSAPFFSRQGKTSTGSTQSWTAWGQARSSDPTESRRRQVVKLLEARGVYPEIAHKIAYGMAPKNPYMMRIYGFAGSDPNDPGSPGDVPVLQATFVGSGVRLWSLAIGYASKAPIEHVEIDELERTVLERPLWGPESVKTVSGQRVYGSGQFVEYRDRRKRGPRKKTGGGMTAAERRKNNKSKEAAIKRRVAIRKRIDALKKTDPLAADRLLERSKRSRKVDL